MIHNMFYYSSGSESVSTLGASVKDTLHCSLLLLEPLGPSNDSSFSLLVDSLDVSAWEEKNDWMPFCHEGVGQIFTGFPPPGSFLLDTFPLLEVGVTLVGGGATASFLGALAATAVK